MASYFISGLREVYLEKDNTQLLYKEQTWQLYDIIAFIISAMIPISKNSLI